MTSIHVLLDLDGTISDSSPGIGRCVREAFVACGYPEPTPDQIVDLIGPPFEITFPMLGVPATDVERVIDAYRDRYEGGGGMFENTVYPGIGDMLEELRSAGHTISLATAKPERTAVGIIDHFGFREYFTVLAGATTAVGTGRRTKGEVIAHALDMLDISHHESERHGVHVVMVGDRNHDVEGASLNQIPCIGVTWGFGSPDELLHAGAVTLVDTPGEVAASVAATYRSGR